MPHGRGSNRGYRPSPPRGRGRGQGRGRGRGRGRGAAGPFRTTHDDAALFAHGEGILVFDGDFEDFNLDHVMGPSRRGGASPARGRGSASPARGRGGFQTPPRGFHPGFQSERGGYRRGKVRGIGFSAGYAGPRIPMSTLERDRPLLRPVVFVRGEHQKTLFQEVEEILHVHGEEGETLDDHAPSADMVERIFHHEEPAEDVSPSLGSDSTSESDDQEEPEVLASVVAAVEEPVPTFVVDTTSSPVVLTSQPSERFVGHTVTGAAPLGEVADEEVIVYVAPHPRTSQSSTTIPSTPSAALEPPPHPSQIHVPSTAAAPSPYPIVSTPVDAVPISFASLADPDVVLSKQVHARRKVGLKPTPRSRKMAKKERAIARRRAERQTLFSMASFGLGVQERSALQEGSAIKDPRHAERRRDDSDVEWGTDDEGGVEEIQSGIGDMELDGKVGDIAAMTRFARGVEGLAGKEVVTIADLEDDAKMKEEDEEQDTDEDASSQEDEDVFDAEERREIGENADIDSSDSSDEDTPRRSFQGRLKRLREKAKGKAIVDADSSSDGEDTDEDGVFGPGFSWADRDEKFLENVDDLLDENEHLLRGGDRKARNRLFKAIQNGDLKDDYESLIPLNMRKKDRRIPPELQDQWERDRAKKAERKRNRALARMQAAVDLSPTRKSTRRKQKTLRAARFEGDTLYADRVNDMVYLEQSIRSFLANVELKSMVLPPKSKEWRKKAHLLAEAFNLKSKSKGKGEGRFTTLIKSSRSGVGVNERKISRLVNGNSGEGFHTSARSTGKVVRHRDGDEVGKMAPKLSDSNIGFKLLQQMGWEEGDRIGVTGGLVNPLTAIIKTTKLGLGAAR